MLEPSQENHFVTQIKSKLSWLAYTNILLGLAAASSLYTGFTFMDAEVQWPSLLMVFLITFAIYNIDRASESRLDKINHPERQAFVFSKRYIFHISIASYATAMIIASSTELRLLLLFPLMVSLLYKYAGLKRIYLLKNIAVTTACAIPATFIPVLSESSIPIGVIWAFFSFFFLKMFVNTVACDIKDIKGDARFAINTLPVKIGIQKTKVTLYVITIIAGCLAVYYGFIFSSTSIYFISMITGYSIFYIYRIGKTEIKFLSDFVMDGEFLLMGFLAYLGSTLMLN